MSINSSIRIKRADGTMAGIYCHWDGYIENNGVILQLAYNTPEKVEELISLGDISSLGYYTVPNDILEAKGKVTIAYHRDRGEPFRQTMQDAEFIYTYSEIDRCWYVQYEEVKKGYQSEAIQELNLFTQWLKREELLLDMIIARQGLIDGDMWRTDDFAEQGKVVEACIRKAKEARQPAIDAYLERQEIYTR